MCISLLRVNLGAGRMNRTKGKDYKIFTKTHKHNKQIFNQLKTMKKLFLILAVVVMVFGAAVDVNAAPKKGGKAKTEQVDKAAEEAKAAEAAKADSLAAVAKLEAEKAETEVAGETMHQVLMQKFLEGGWGWMLPILVVLVLGLAIAVERILFLSFSTINNKSFIAEVEEALKKGGIEAAKEVCRNKRGPIASIFYQGLDRYHLGLDAVEKAVVSYGSVQTGRDQGDNDRDPGRRSMR